MSWWSGRNIVISLLENPFKKQHCISFNLCRWFSYRIATPVHVQLLLPIYSPHPNISHHLFTSVVFPFSLMLLVDGLSVNWIFTISREASLWGGRGVAFITNLYNKSFKIFRCRMCPTCSYHLQAVKLLIKYELLQS